MDYPDGIMESTNNNPKLTLKLNFRHGISLTEALQQLNTIFHQFEDSPKLYEGAFKEQNVVIDVDNFKYGQKGEIVPEGYLYDLWSEKQKRWWCDIEYYLQDKHNAENNIPRGYDNEYYENFYEAITNMFPHVDYVNPSNSKSIEFAYDSFVKLGFKKYRFNRALALFTSMHTLNYWRPAHFTAYYNEIVKEDTM